MENLGNALARFVATSHDVQARFFSENHQRILDAAAQLAERVRNGGKVLFFGNGGSAADAQHLAAEFVGRFIPDRRPLPAISLATDTSALTAIGNDYGFEHLFSRQVEALGHPGDAAVAISTSGNSPNVVKGAATARRAGLLTIGLTGASGGRLRDEADILFAIPSTITPRIQEAHILLGHSLCELVDRTLFPEAYDD